MTTKSTQSTALTFAIIACVVLGLGVLLGAFGAHGLKSFASPKAIQWWQTATLYLFIHGLGVLANSVLIYLGLIHKKAVICMLLGMAIFCGTLYGMALGAPRWLGAITPIGGSLMVVAWFWLAVSLIQAKKQL